MRDLLSVKQEYYLTATFDVIVSWFFSVVDEYQALVCKRFEVKAADGVHDPTSCS